jgi:hypothetical protein
MLPDIEVVSAAVHAAWMDSKRAQGVTTRKAEDGEELMAPYEQLSEKAKQLDRGTVQAVYAAINASASETQTSVPADTAAKMVEKEYARGLEDAAQLCEGKLGVWPIDQDGSRDSEWGPRYASCIRDLNPEPTRGG